MGFFTKVVIDACDIGNNEWNKKLKISYELNCNHIVIELFDNARGTVSLCKVNTYDLIMGIERLVDLKTIIGD